MSETIPHVHWWTNAEIRVCGETLVPAEFSASLRELPALSLLPGESRVPLGTCKSAGYVVFEARFDSPARPTEGIRWVNSFAERHSDKLEYYIHCGVIVKAFIAIHSNVLAIGFDVPSVSALERLRIPLDIEVYH